VEIPFFKMHGLGNDYVYVDAELALAHAGAPIADPAALARAIADRHRGVGADGLVLVTVSHEADVGMRMWNADGSESAMCGNALRCVARYAFDAGRVAGPELRVETGAGIHPATVRADGSVRASLGRPVLERRAIPMRGEPSGERVLDRPFEVDGVTLRVSAASMGNPHLIVEVDDVEDAPVATLGPRLEADPCFPERTNVEFIQVLGRDRLRARVWERGSGETQACGSGASAAVVTATLRGRIEPPVTVELRGGPLGVDWREGEAVWIDGPATYVFEGIWRVPAAAPFKARAR
jgi:diaminopimelate epimerase